MMEAADELDEILTIITIYIEEKEFNRYEGEKFPY